jgi:hypothetical protein
MVWELISVEKGFVDSLEIINMFKLLRLFAHGMELTETLLYV